MKLKTPLDVDLINKTFFPNDIPKDINKGRCFLWAYIAFHMYEGVQLWDMGSHAFIRYRGKFYDSERPQGERDWRDLPATNFGKGCGCKVCRKPAARLSINAFKHKDNWGRNAKKRLINWESIRSQVQETIAKLSR